MLALVAEGLRNAEIAERLVVSVRTVDHHVSSILRKLDLESRGQAAAAAAELGLDPPNIGDSAAETWAVLPMPRRGRARTVVVMRPTTERRAKCPPPRSAYWTHTSCTSERGHDMFKIHTRIVGLVAVLAAIGSASVAEAQTDRDLRVGEAWQQIARDNLQDLAVTEAWQQIARDNLDDLQAVAAWQGIARDNLRNLRVQERHARRRARKGH